MRRALFKMLLPLVLFSGGLFAADSFTAADRRLLIELNVQMKEITKRLDDTNTTMHTLALLFGGMFVALIGLTIGDRRTAIFRAKDETVKELNKSW